jgi:sodium/hydrogen antiporter
MLEHPLILLVAALILGYGIFSKRSEKSVITAPMVFVIVGLVASFFVSDEIRSNVQAPWVKVVAELTLILVLFVDSSTLDFRRVYIERSLPIRLLLIGLPITMVLGILFAIPMFPDQNVWLLAMMALILSPTDAALGLAVVTSEQVPPRIRQTINVESGLNDGIALPPILVCLAVLSGEAQADAGASYWALFTVKQFVFGPIIGGLVGWAGGTIVEKAAREGWMNETFQRLASLSIAILAYAFAEMVHGNGFIAAYFAGMLLGTRTRIFRERIHGFGEAASQVLILIIFLLLGMILLPLSFPYWDWMSLFYAILSLTVIRMIPVALCLWNSDLDKKTIWFIAWFGPRGIASILYLLMAVIAIGAEGHRRILSVITLTVLLSIFLHGISAVPYSRIFAKKSEG